MTKRTQRTSGPSHVVDENIDRQAETNDILRQGREAMDAYDYDLARNLLERAFSDSGSTESALVLLTLLVDHLVADDDALALWSKLSSESRRSSDIRVLLALSAARLGDVSRAKHLVAGIDGSRAADVLALLATNALESGDWAEAGKLVEDARSRDPAHPGARDAAQRIAQVRSVERSRLEDEMTFAFELGNRNEALRLAESIVAVFPESAAARQILRAATDERRHEDAKQHISNAEEALARGDLDTALQWLRRAEQVLTTSTGNNALRTHITVLETEAKNRATAAIVADIMDLLGKDPKNGLLRYALANEEIRNEVRKTNRSDLLGILDRILQIVQKRVHADDAVNAALDLVDSMNAVERDPKSALGKIAAHERILAGITEAAKVQARARELLENERIRRVSEIFDAARKAIDEGNVPVALDILSRLDMHEVRASERDRLDSLRSETNAIIERQSLEQRYEQLLLSDPLAACEVAEQILARPESNRAQWQAAIAAARRKARRMFGVWIAEEPAIDSLPPIEAPSVIDCDVPVKLPATVERTLQWLDPEARVFVATEGHDRWIFIRVIQAATGKIQSRVILRMPEKVGAVEAMVTNSNSLVIISDNVALLEISLTSWDPIFWRSSQELVPRGEIAGRVKIVPDTRFVWFVSRRPGDLGHVCVVDAQRRRVTRELEDIWGFIWVVDTQGARMICSGSRARVTLHDMRGAPIQERIAFSNSIINHAVVHPSGQGLLVTSGIEEDLVEFEEIGCAPNPWGHKWSGTTEAYRASTLATSLRGRNAYFLAMKHDREAVLEEMGFVEGGLRKRWHKTLPATPYFVQDAGNQNVIALFQNGDRLHLIPLSDQMPEIPVIHRQNIYVPNPLMDYGCSFPEGRTGATFQYIALLGHLSPSLQIERLHALAESLLSTPSDVFDMHRMLVSMEKEALAEALFTWLKSNMPSDDYANLILAMDALNRLAFPEAIQIFDTIQLDSIAESYRPHVCHEFALALIHVGEFTRAIPILHEGIRAGESSCNLQELLDLVSPFPDKGENASGSVLIRIRLAVQNCDFWLNNRAFDKAREAIDVLDIWEAGEVQSLARLAFVYLQFEPRDDAERFRKALALARFLDEHRAAGPLRKELVVDSAKWPKSQLDEVEMQASKWLEGLE